jgi:Asp-tRNA(Asn)/Glu-tRNA(Gln) amidotransferase C subunit
MAEDDPLIIQFAAGAAVERQLRSDAPPSVASGAAVLDAGPADDRGRLEPPAAGQVVLSVPSPEALARQADDVRRVIDAAGDGVEPLVVVVEAAEELREDELAPVVDAARRTRRSVILRISRDA